MKKMIILAALLCSAAVGWAQVTFTCTAGKNFGGNEGAQRMFDGNTATKFCTDAGTACYALFTASEPVYVWGYDMTTANDSEGIDRRVKSLIFCGTNDASVAANPNADGWVTLSSFEDKDYMQKKNFYTQRYFCDKSAVTTPYKYFKVVFTKGGEDRNYIQVSKFEPCYETYKPVTYDWYASDGGDGSKKAVDGLLSEKWEGQTALVGKYLTIKTSDDQPYTVKSYSFSTHDDGDCNDRAPKEWRLEGSNDNSNWITIDEVSGGDPIKNENYKTFDFKPSNVDGAFKYIRLTLNSMKGNGWQQLGEFHVVSACQTHDWEQTGGVEPTCVSEGGGEMTCSVCGVTKLSDVIPATGIHTYVNGYCSVCNTPDPSFATLSDGYYQIGNKDQMKWFKAMVEAGNFSINAKLTSDIDMQSEALCVGLENSSIRYAGEFDGQGYAIKNLSYGNTSMNQVGLFCLTEGAHIHDLAMVNARLIGNANVGCIVGRAYGGTIERCAVLYSYAEGRDHVGTIAGDMNVKDGVGVTISNCYSNSASVSRQYQCGGLVGTSNGGILEKCIFLGTVDNPNGTSAGLISLIDSDTYGTTIRNNAIFPSSVSGSSAYAIVNTAGRNCSFADNYDFNQTEYIVNGAVSPKNLTQKDDQNGCQIDIEQISTQDTYTSLLGWDFTDTWKYVSGQYPILKWMTYSTNLILWSASDYDYFATQVNTNGQAKAKADVYADIDLSSGTHAPIGTTTYYYAGNFNGNGHSITLNIDATTGYQGFFGCAGDGASISNLILRGSVKGNGNTAALIGEAKKESGEKGTITISHVGLEVNVESTGNYNGAFVGNNWGATINFHIDNSYNTGNITGPSNNSVMGGYNWNSNVFTNVYNTGSVSNATDQFCANAANAGTFTNCYTTSTTDASVAGLTKSVTDEQVKSGELCYKLGSEFTQDLSAAGYPTFGSKVVAAGQWFSDADDVYYNLEGGNYTVYQLNMAETNTKYAVPANVTAKNVSVARTITADKTIGLCLPFDMAIPAGWTVYELVNVEKDGDNATMVFDKATAIEAAKPYLVKTTADVTTIEAADAAIATEAATEASNGVNMIGTFAQGNLAKDDYYISTNGELKKLTADSATLKGFRVYFTQDGAGAKNLSIVIGDDTNAISKLNGNDVVVEGIYNLAGQRMSGLQKGINIVNGKKIIK